MNATDNQKNSKPRPVRLTLSMRDPYDETNEWILGRAVFRLPVSDGERPLVEMTGVDYNPYWIAVAGAIAANSFARVFGNMLAGKSGVMFEDVRVHLGSQPQEQEGDRS